MVVDADGVVAAAHKPSHEHVGVIMRKIIRGEAEVYAVKALLHARQTLELEMSAHALEPAVLSGRRILQALRRKVERASGNDILPVVDLHPSAVFANDVRLCILE